MTPAKITESLKRLNALEFSTGKLAAALTEGEKQFEITRLRGILPASILAHHDRMLQRGRRSIAAVLHGVCSACHLRLPGGHAVRLRDGSDLDVCDHCGTFIYLEAPVADVAGPVVVKPRASKRGRAAVD